MYLRKPQTEDILLSDISIYLTIIITMNIRHSHGTRMLQCLRLYQSMIEV